VTTALQQLDLFADPARRVFLDDARAAAVQRRPRSLEDVRALRRRQIRTYLAAEGLPTEQARTTAAIARDLDALVDEREDLSAGVAILDGPGACRTCGHARVKHEVGGRRHCEACTCLTFVRIPRRPGSTW
jgi:hypothetical protein